MFNPHPYLITPENSTIVWRYMDLSRFLSLLHSKSLYFSKLDQLDDKQEGQLPPSMRESLDLLHPEVREQLTSLQTQFADEFILNCWHENTHESVAMWKLYTRGLDGIVIKSTIGRIKSATEDISIPMNVGRIHYLDYRDPDARHPGFNQEGFNALEPYFCKRLCFKHEHEVRLAFPMPRTPPKFREVHSTPIVDVGTVTEVHLVDISQSFPVNLQILIEEIVVSPRYPKYEIEALQAILNEKVNGIKIKPSELSTI
jgi:hypothetical protein